MIEIFSVSLACCLVCYFMAWMAHAFMDVDAYEQAIKGLQICMGVAMISGLSILLS